MPQIIKQPTHIQAHGDPPKVIEEFIGRANSQTTAVSIARMVSPAGWNEPGQRPDFDEFTVVLRGQLNIETREGTDQLTAGQAVIVWRGEWVRYSTPAPEGQSISQFAYRHSLQRPCTETLQTSLNFEGCMSRQGTTTNFLNQEISYDTNNTEYHEGRGA
jgi:quercetin dioxygenase-like cupin family protein